jgi:hypothetical protein
MTMKRLNHLKPLTPSVLPDFRDGNRLPLRWRLLGSRQAPSWCSRSCDRPTAPNTTAFCTACVNRGLVRLPILRRLGSRRLSQVVDHSVVDRERDRRIDRVGRRGRRCALTLNMEVRGGRRSC